VVRGLKCPRHTACVKIPLLAKAARSRAPVNDGPADNQLMVKVIAIEGNKVKLSRKALLRDQKGSTKKPEPKPEASE